MFYRALRWISEIVLHWFYRDIVVEHRDRIPASGPMLIAVNHPNAMVDAIVAQWVVPRRLRITAKATLADTLPGALFVKLAGLIPLRRQSDEPPGTYDATRNRRAFQSVIDALARGDGILIFPEGKSHNDPVIAPLKRGLATMALRARDAGVRGIRIVPIGLTFEDKARPNTAVLAAVGDVLALDEWPSDDVEQLTDVIAERLNDIAFRSDVPRVEEATPHCHRIGLVSLAAWWGRVIHKIPVELARRMALARSTNADEPAMYTMIYGVALTLIAYAVQMLIVWTMVSGVAAGMYLVLLVAGAYWVAYARHSCQHT